MRAAGLRVSAVWKGCQTPALVDTRARSSCLEADAVCIALPAPRLASYSLPCIRPGRSAAGDTICLLSHCQYRLQTHGCAHPLHGMGFVVPAIEQRTLMACSFSSVKFTGRAPQHQVLLRAFVGGALQQAAYDLSDYACNTPYSRISATSSVSPAHHSTSVSVAIPLHATIPSWARAAGDAP